MSKKRKRKKAKRGGLVRRAVALVLSLALVLAVLALAYVLVLFPDQHADGNGRSFDFRPSADIDELAETLAREKVVTSAFWYGVYHRLLASDEPLREHVLLARNLTPSEVLRRLVASRGPVPVRVVIREGVTRFAIAQELARLNVCEAEAFLAATANAPEGVNAPSAEGYLFPDTYELMQGSECEDVVERLLETYERRTDELFERHEDTLAELAMSRHEVLVLASVVEREAAVADERPVIAGVFLNRLHSDTFRPLHRLQADPTVSYGCESGSPAPSCEGYNGRITRAMLQDTQNEYNTYRHGGLPPGPIANPGLSSIRAVLEPQEHDYLYFVARGGGRHAFAADLETHNDNVQRFLR